MKICPKCGEDVAILSVSGPSTGRVAPCGHDVNPMAVQRRETLVVVDSDRRTITVPDEPLPDRLAAIQVQLDRRDVVTTADVQAISAEVRPVVSGLAEALQPVLDAFRDLAADLGPDAGRRMSEPSQDPRFDTREEEIQYYIDFSEGFGWSDGERRDFAKTVVRLKEQPIDSEADAPTP